MSLFDINKWRFIDQSTLGPTFCPLQSFAIDDTLCTSVGEKESIPIIRTWVHHESVVLGIQDSRLPSIDKGIEYLHSLGFNVIVRNSGGLAVVLDEGILNISLILKENRQISINNGYEVMYNLVLKMFKDITMKIEAREIEGSYCPGSFDLSIDGKKFAGISQRRVRGGVAVQIYLCITGNGSERAIIIRDFYEKAVNGAKIKFRYPIIVPTTMASLTELLNVRLAVEDVIVRLLRVFQRNPGASIIKSQLTNDELPLFEENLKRMLKRNEQIN